MNSCLHIKIALIAVATVMIACNSEPIEYPPGGYQYLNPRDKNDSNFFYLPVRDSMSGEDSFYTGYISPIYFAAFNERNLSLGPAKTNIFRFVYYGLGQEDVIITITPKEIVVKKREKGTPYGGFDKSRLTEVEQVHFDLLQRDFPLAKKQLRPGRRRYVDSIIRIYPELLDPKYYAGLYDKIKQKDTVPFIFSTKKISIRESSFTKLIRQFNDCGYWSLPFEFKCSGGSATHMSGLSLEANTRTQYNIVHTHSCPEDSSAFIKACQQLIDMAGMGKEIDLLWN